MIGDSNYLLQKVDCNCNDCKFMVRDIDKFKKSLDKHKARAMEDFDREKKRIIDNAISWKDKGEISKHDVLIKEAKRMRFVFDKKSVSINYGDCTKLNKEVSFIPGVCQIETQECFTHRKD